MKRLKKTAATPAQPNRSFASPLGTSPALPDWAARGQLAFGVEPLRELLAAGQQLDVLYVSRRVSGRFEAEIRRVRDSGGKVAAVDDQFIRRLCGPEANHQGVAALCRGFEYASLDEVAALGPDPLLVVDGVTDPRNLGGIMRSAEGAGVRAMILARDRTAEVSAAAIKTSAGARAYLKIARCGNVASALEMLKKRGYWVGGLAPQSELSLYELDVGRKLALVAGGEQRGLRPIVAKSCDFLVAIPMYGRIASLNVAVASAVALYEIARRRAALSRAQVASGTGS